MCPLLLLLALAVAAPALEDPAAHLEQMARDYDAARAAYIKGWLAAADLSPIPEPVLGADPRKSDMDRAAHVRELNGVLLALRQQRGERLPLEDERQASSTMTPEAWAKVVSDAAELRGKSSPPAEAAKPRHHEPTATSVKP